MTIPYSKDWQKMLCMTENLLNSSVKQALGVSPSTLLFGDAIPTQQSLMAEIDQMPSATASTSKGIGNPV